MPNFNQIKLGDIVAIAFFTKACVTKTADMA